MLIIPPANHPSFEREGRSSPDERERARAEQAFYDAFAPRRALAERLARWLPMPRLPGGTAGLAKRREPVRPSPSRLVRCDPHEC